MNNSKCLSSFSKPFLWTLSSSVPFNGILSIIYLNWIHNNQMQNALDLFPFTDKSQLMKGCLCVRRRGKANEWFFQPSPFRLAQCRVLEYRRTAGVVRARQGWQHVWILSITERKRWIKKVCVIEDTLFSTSLGVISFSWLHTHPRH